MSNEQGEGEQNTRRSKGLFARAQRVIPGGVSSPVRAFTAVGGTPRFITRGSGPHVWDADDNRYIDYVMSWGPLIHGHAFKPVIDAVLQTAPNGTSFGAPTAEEVTLAEAVTDAILSVDQVRFVSSGTEATMSAIRLARAFTDRDSIVTFAGNYHGHADMLLAQAGSGNLTFGIPSSPGVPEGAARTTIVAQYNDLASLEAVMHEHGSHIAAVIVEPVAGNMGVVPPLPGFLGAIRRLTLDTGSLLIFDEVITGFRIAYGGAQETENIRPDLTTLGKIVGGGLPVGAYGGRRDILERVAPSGPVYQAGTLSGNPVAMAAGIASLEALREDGFYDRLREGTDRLASGLTAAAGDAGIPLMVNARTGMLTAFFTEQPVSTLADAQASDTVRYARFFHGMLARGVYLPPSQFEAWMVSSAHSEEIIDCTIEAAHDALKQIAAEPG